MALKVEKVDVWAGPLMDRPGSLSQKLATLAAGGVNLQFVLARRAPDKPGMGVVFVAGVKGATQAKAAAKAGLIRTKTMASVCVTGPNRRGIGAKMTAAMAKAGINVRGFSAAGIGAKFVAFLAFDSTADATRAMKVLKKL